MSALEMFKELKPEQHPGQSKTMLVCDGENTVPAECGHWYSPNAVREIVNAAIDHAAKVAREYPSVNGFSHDIAAAIEKEKV